MKYIFAKDEDLDAAGITQAGNTDKKHLEKKSWFESWSEGKCKRTGKLWTVGGDNLVRTKK